METKDEMVELMDKIPGSFRSILNSEVSTKYNLVTSLKLDVILQAKMMMEERIRENKLNVPTSNNMNSTTATDTDETVKSKVKLKNIIQAKV